MTPRVRPAMAGWLAPGLMLVLAGCGGAGERSDPPAPDPVADVQANLWEWNWRSVARECTEVLGPAGYAAVQVAPPQDSLRRTRTGDGSDVLHPWWEVYQPARYELTSRMGGPEDFEAMVTACDDAGVEVHVDAVVNHMTGQGDTSYGGARYAKYAYDGLYEPADFHAHPDDCPLPGTGGDLAGEIVDYGNVIEVFNCELLGLSDLDTGSPEVRADVASYLNRLIGLGVAGFRVDAAKHVGPTDLAAIEALLDDTPDGTRPVLTLEVLPGSPGEAAAPAYLELGQVLGIGYAGVVSQAFQGNLADLVDLPQNPRLLGSEHELVFVANHDTERNGWSMTQRDEGYALANGFMLAYGYGTPQVYASFSWLLPDESPPSDEGAMITDTECDGDVWLCTHRDPGVLAMVRFHNAVGTSPVRDVTVAGDTIGLARGDYGVAGFNTGDAEATLDVPTGLPVGTYCDLVTGGVQDGSCAGTSVAVSDSGTASLPLPASGSVAVTWEQRLND